MLKITVILLYLFILCVTGKKKDVYKIGLSQRGYVQFLEYDVKNVPIKEFTFCTWLRIHNLENDQTIFSFIGKPYKKVIEVSLDAGGDYLNVYINNKLLARIVVEWRIHTWKHLCMSYQSAYGVWLIYLNGNLELCEVAESHVGFLIPGQGRILLGYGGINAYGSHRGLEGEIYAFYMILWSTVQNANATANNLPKYNKSTDFINKFNNNFKYSYVILGDLTTAKSNDVFIESEQETNNEKLPPNHVRFSTRYSFVDHDVGLPKPKPVFKDLHINEVDEMEILDIPSDIRNEHNVSFWNFINNAGNSGNFKKAQPINIKSAIDIESEILPEISLFERPPPLGATTEYDVNKKSKSSNFILDKFNHKVVYDIMKNVNRDKEINLLELETPPPIPKNEMVFGHWSSPNFADNVLKYLKMQNVVFKPKNNVPTTIPLTRISDSYPYSSETVIKSTLPPRKTKYSNYSPWFSLKKYDIDRTEKNVQIELHDVRQDILKYHALTEPKLVTVTYRGDPIQSSTINDKYITNEDSLAEYSSNEVWRPKPFNVNFNETSKENSNPQNNLLKSLNISDIENDMYLNSLLHVNKWHNVRSYNEHSSRFVNLNDMFLNAKGLKANNEEFHKGRRLASQVSDQSRQKNKNYNSDVLYNNNSSNETNFNRHVKIGHALDERFIIGNSEMENSLSFLGGDDRVPTINNYRSDNVYDNNMSSDVPASLNLVSLKKRVCHEANVYNVPKSIFTLRANTSKQSAIALVLLSNNICASFDDLFLEALIDWKRTPIRLFGGAHPIKANDICS